MKKLLLILVVAILVLILPAGVVAAKAEANRIEFNLDGIYKIVGDNLTVSAVLTGNLREKDTGTYLSPLNGTITIDGKEYDISVKARKQSNLLTHQPPPPIGGTRFDLYTQQIVVNVKGSKAASYSGFVALGKVSYNGGVDWEPYSKLAFDKVGGLYRCNIDGSFSR